MLPSRATRPSTMSNTPENNSRNPPQWILAAANVSADPTKTRVPTVVRTFGGTCLRINHRTSGSSSRPKPSRTGWGITFIARGK